MREFKNVKIDLLSNNKASNGVIFDKESLIKAVGKLDKLKLLINYDSSQPSVGTASNFKIEGDYVVTDVEIQDSALPTQLGLGIRGETSENTYADDMVFFTQEIFSISTIPVGKHLHEGLDILE